jgi:dCTP deaminase
MIVTDSDLQTLITDPVHPLLTDFDNPLNWQDDKSLVQPSSVDLHIGAIFQPGVKAGKSGSAVSPKSELVLKTGHTAIVGTQESIHLPNNYAAFGFPPSHVSSRALLMTNPGHIDPGYSGQLHFTVINMGREDFVLRSKDLIVTLLVFKLAVPSAVDYAKRNAGRSPSPITQSSIDLLSQDFVDVEKRAADVARKILGYATVGATILAVILGWGFNQMDKRLNGIEEMQTKITQLETSNAGLVKDIQETKEQLKSQLEIDRRLTAIELRTKTKENSR